MGELLGCSKDSVLRWLNGKLPPATVAVMDKRVAVMLQDAGSPAEAAVGRSAEADQVSVELEGGRILKTTQGPSLSGGVVRLTETQIADFRVASEVKEALAKEAKEAKAKDSEALLAGATRAYLTAQGAVPPQQASLPGVSDAAGRAAQAEYVCSGDWDASVRAGAAAADEAAVKVQARHKRLTELARGPAGLASRSRIWGGQIGPNLMIAPVLDTRERERERERPAFRYDGGVNCSESHAPCAASCAGHRL